MSAAAVDPAGLGFAGSERGPVGGAARGGYVMASSDGKIYTFGGAPSAGEPRDFRLTKPVVDIASTPSGEGHWLVASDGGIFTFGDAEFKGSMASGLLSGRIVGLMPQGGHVRAPVLRHLAFRPTTVDTSNGPATIKFRANITDDLSGHGVDPPLRRWDRGETQMIFMNRAGSLTHMGLNVFFRDDDRIAGDRLDGIYRAHGTIPAHSPPGTWRLSSITMSGGVGNMVSIDGAVLAQAGFPTTFEQVGAGDADPPQVTSLSVTPDRIDTSLGTAEVRISARVVDNGTGVRSACAGFSNRNSNVGTFLRLVSGDEHDGVYEGTVTVPRYAHQGWWPAGMQVRDGAGNINGFGANFPSVGFTPGPFEATLSVPRYSEQGTWTLTHVGLGDNALNWNHQHYGDLATFEVIRTHNRP